MPTAKPNRFSSSISFGASEPAPPIVTRANPGASHLDATMRPKTPAKAKQLRERLGSEHPPQAANGHHIGEGHLYDDGLLVSPTRTHDMMVGRRGVR